MADYTSYKEGSSSGLKKAITIGVIVLLAIGLGFYLFKISPQEQQNLNNGAGLFDLSNLRDQTEPASVQPDDHVLGNPLAKNTVLAYEDLQCPAGASFEPILLQIPQQLTDTKLVFRHFPLLGIHKNAAYAAFASESAGAQGKFWEFAGLAYERQGQWSDLSDPLEQFVQIAGEAGVPNIDQFRQETIDKKYKDRVQRDLREATQLKVSGTPSLFMNGKPIELGDINSLKQQAENLYIK